jgi:hypothetical protein
MSSVDEMRIPEMVEDDGFKFAFLEILEIVHREAVE